ncbi:MAG: diaminopimelate epimerase [Haloferacaceae archaeon]
MSIIETAVPVEKYHGTGNDFVVVDADHCVPDRAAFARAHCDRESGVGADESAARAGADGVLFLALEDQYDPVRVVMTLVQPDGSVAAMCGNGARVVATWAHERTGADEFMIDTPAGTRRATVAGVETAGGDAAVETANDVDEEADVDTAGDDADVADDGGEVGADGDGTGDPRHRSVTIEMGVPSFDPRDVPAVGDDPLVEEAVEGLTVTAVNTGVPHAVAFVDDVDAVDLDAVAPPVRHADRFPQGTNVTLASPDGRGGFDQRTFERGVEGETRSCGTGAVAVAAAASRLGLVDTDGEIRVRPPGGELRVAVPDGASATLRGPVEHEYATELDPVPDRARRPQS